MSLINFTVGELLEKQVNLYPHHEAVIYPELNLRKTYLEFDEMVDETAKGLMALGIEKGENVAIWSDNKPEWITSQFATGKMGAVLVTVNTNYQAAELEYLLKQSESTTLIMAESYKGTSYLDVLKQICPDLNSSIKGELSSDTLPHLKNVILISDEKKPGCYTWTEVIELGKNVTDDMLAKRKQELDIHDVINMQYTSGTTGFPKGVMLTHNNIVNNGKQIAECMNFSHNDRLCIPVPFFHCFGCVLGILAAVSKGATMVILEQFDAAKVLQAVSDEKCTALHGVPTMFIAELNHPNFKKFDLSHLRTGIMAGSTCPVEVMRDVMNKMGAEEITITYGQTESSPAITQTRTDDRSEEHTSELQSRGHLVCRLLLEKKKENNNQQKRTVNISLIHDTKENIEKLFTCEGQSCIKGNSTTAIAYRRDSFTRSVLTIHAR